MGGRNTTVVRQFEVGGVARGSRGGGGVGGGEETGSRCVACRAPLAWGKGGDWYGAGGGDCWCMKKVLPPLIEEEKMRV